MIDGVITMGQELAAGKSKKCKICGNVFLPISSMSKVCSVPCAVAAAEQIRKRAEIDAKKVERKKYRDAKERLKSRKDHINELQAIFNKWIRARDNGQPCISCGRMHNGQLHAGHYRSVGAEPSLRFEPLNVHLQCAPCNTHLSGNLVAYRTNLVNKIGAPAVEWLESKHEPKKYAIDEIREMKKFFKEKIKESSGGGRLA